MENIKFNFEDLKVYQKAIDYGSKLGLPDYQLDFSPFHKSV